MVEREDRSQPAGKVGKTGRYIMYIEDRHSVLPDEGQGGIAKQGRPETISETSKRRFGFSTSDNGGRERLMRMWP